MMFRKSFSKLSLYSLSISLSLYSLKIFQTSEKVHQFVMDDFERWCLERVSLNSLYSSLSISLSLYDLKIFQTSEKVHQFVMDDDDDDEFRKSLEIKFRDFSNLR